MRNYSALVVVLVLAMLPGVALAQDPFARWDHFSATRTGGPIQRDPMKIYRSGNQLRADHDDQIHITNMKDLSSVSIADNKCVQMRLPDGPAYPFDAQSLYGEFKLERTWLEGEETVDGHTCKLEALNYTQADSETFIKMKLWEAQDLDGFPIKIEVLPNIRKKPFTFHYSDVSLQPPDAALFKVPAHCVMLSDALAESVRKKKSSTPSTKPAVKPPDKPAATPTANPPAKDGAESKPQ